MPNERTETMRYAEYKFPVDGAKLGEMMSDLKERVKKLEDAGKLKKGYGEDVFPHIEAMAKKAIDLNGMDQEKWWSAKYDYTHGMDRFLGTLRIQKNYNRREVGKRDFEDWIKEGLSFLYAMVEEAEKGTDLSDDDKADTFYKEKFEPNYAPNIELREKKAKEDKEFDEWVKYRQEKARQKEEEQRQLRAHNQEVIKFAESYKPMLEKQEEVIRQYSIAYDRLNSTGDWPIANTAEYSESQFYYRNKEESIRKLEAVLDEFVDETALENDMKSDPEKESILKDTKKFDYIKELNIREAISDRDHAVKQIVNTLCKGLSHSESQISVEKLDYEASFKKHLKAYEEIAKEPLTPERDEKMRKLHEEFVKYHQEPLKDVTHSFEIAQDTIEQLNKIREHSSVAREYMDTNSSYNFSCSYFERLKKWKQEYEREMENHEQLLKYNSDLYKRQTREFDEKWNKTTEELKELVKEGYSLEDNIEKMLVLELGQKTYRVEGATPKNIKTFIDKHETYKKSLDAKREEIIKKTAQVKRLLDERDKLIESTGDNSLKEKYDLDNIKYVGAKEETSILEATEEVQKHLIAEKNEVDLYSQDAKQVASEYYNNLIKEKEYEAWQREEEERLRKEEEKERQRVEREMQEVEDECNRLDEELARTREQRYSNQDQVKYLNNLVDGLSLEQQESVLGAYGLNQDERDKFANGQTHLLSFLDKVEEKKQDNKENVSKNVEHAVEKTEENKTEEKKTEAKPSSKSKDLSVALATRQGLLDQINKNDDELYRELLKRYEDVRTGNYTEEEKDNYYKKFEEEIDNAKKADRLNRGQLNLSERVCKFLALGQNVQLPIFKKDNLTTLADSIRNKEAIIDASVQMALQEEKRIEEQKKNEDELTKARDELMGLLQESEKIDNEIDELGEDFYKLRDEKQPEIIGDYQNEYYNPRMEKLKEFHDKLSKPQNIQRENLNKMEELRGRIEGLATQMPDPETKAQLDELFRRQDELTKDSYWFLGNDIEDDLRQERDRLKLENRERKNKNLKDKIDKISDFVSDWQKKYDDTIKKQDVKSQIEDLRKLKAKYDENDSVLPTTEAMKEVLDENEKIQDTITSKYSNLEDDYEKAQKRLTQMTKNAEEIDGLIETMGFELKADDIRKSLNDEYKSFSELKRSNKTKDENIELLTDAMDRYMRETALENRKKYREDSKQEARDQFKAAAEKYLNYLNQKLEGEDAREVLRAYQEKNILMSTFHKMVQLPEYFGDSAILDTVEKENTRNSADRENAEKAIKTLNEKIAEKDKKIEEFYNEYNKYVNEKKEFIGDPEDTNKSYKVDDHSVNKEKDSIEIAEENAKKEASNRNDIISQFDDLKRKRGEWFVKLDYNKTDLEKDKQEDKRIKKDMLGEISNRDYYNQKYMTEFEEDKRKAESLKDPEGLTGLAKVTKIYDSQVKYEESLERGFEKLKGYFDRQAGPITNVIENDKKMQNHYSKVKEAIDQIEKNYAESKTLCDNVLDAKQHESAIRQEIRKVFDTVKGTKDKGVGSHAKFREFKNAMENYLNAYPDGQLSGRLSDAEKNNINEHAYRSCIAYVNRHLKTSGGVQSLKHQVTDDGALRKQGTVRILELMKGLPEFKNQFELAEDAPQMDEKAPNDKVKDNNKETRVKLNFNQLKASLGENAKTVKAKKKEDLSKHAYADLNAAISKKENPEGKKR